MGTEVNSIFWDGLKAPKGVNPKEFFEEMKGREQHMYNFGFHLPLFSSMSNSARNMVMSSLVKRAIEPGQVIMRQTISGGFAYECRYTTPATSKDLTGQLGTPLLQQDGSQRFPSYLS